MTKQTTITVEKDSQAEFNDIKAYFTNVVGYPPTTLVLFDLMVKYVKNNKDDFIKQYLG